MTILDAMLGITSALCVGFILAMAFGQLVTVGRLEKAEHEAEVWQKAHDRVKEAWETEVRTRERAQLSAEITDKVMNALGHIHRAGDDPTKVGS